MSRPSISTRIAWPLLFLATVSGAAFAQPASEITWKVASTFPQRTQIVDGNRRWRTPEGALPNPGESFDQWYARLAAANQSPYSALPEGQSDVWSEDDQQYQRDFLEYVRGNLVATVIEVRGPLAAAASCTWTVDAVVVSDHARCDYLETLVPSRRSLVRVQADDDPARPDTADGRLFAAGYVHPRRVVILGLGDSYASGEGNPDVPTRWNDKPLPDDNSLDWLKSSWKKPGDYIEKGASWRDTNCHRSYWNQQNVAAARLAATDPQQEVVFLQYACSGAEIFDGILVRQLDPPGIGVEKKSGCQKATSSKCRLKMSQLRAAVSALCRVTPERAKALTQRMDDSIAQAGAGGELAKMEAYRRVPRDMRVAGEGMPASALDLVSCSDMVQPDAILMSVGGNDAGFAQLVAWALMPRDGANAALDVPYRLLRRQTVVCPPAQKEWCRGATSDTLAIQLPFRYRWLAEAMGDIGLKSPPGNTLVTSYPDVLRNNTDVVTAGSTLCGDSTKNRDTQGVKDRNNQWTAFNLQIPRLLRFIRPWYFGLDVSPAPKTSWRLSPGHELVMRVMPDLRRSLQASVAEAQFTYVDTSDAFVGRGWCTKSESESQNRSRNQRLPLPGLGSGSHNQTPHEWQAFSPRNRLVRTANDSYFTQLSTRSGDVNGTMHPTAEGHFKLAEQLHRRLASALRSSRESKDTGAGAIGAVQSP
ncbi:hypothetical protein [Lysobacter enzymogenes]|uniref:hypothetical protein n=1 Tax=Lysobacter enzymogenes TaxID=69 RepID=UPI001A97D2E4|nr:hypothetical protein [Lysobacter enzymogenes]QQP96619.1 hypothetical protein JHW38_00745 [Lysobacter enzymogenes]